MKRIKKPTKFIKPPNPLKLEKGTFRASFTFSESEIGQEISIPMILRGEPTPETLAVAREETLKTLLTAKTNIDSSQFKTTAEETNETNKG